MPDETAENLLKSLDEQLMRLLRGETAGTVVNCCENDPVLKGLCETVNRLVLSYNDACGFIQSLAEGNLETPAPLHNLLASPFKQLQANLLHLTWQTGQIAAGDYSQRVHFMGAFSAAFNSMVEALDEKRRMETQLREAEARVKHLEGIIPICMYCKKIRDDKASWQQMEQYISEHSEALFSHSICPECHKQVKADIEKLKEARRLEPK
jgi:hypothetical protein